MNGDYGFLTRDESWAFDETLLDERGQVRWNYRGSIAQALDIRYGTTSMAMDSFTS